MKKVIALVLSAVFVLGMLAGCTANNADDNSSADTKEMTIAFCTWAGYAPLFIAVDQGYFADYGYDVNIVIMEDESTYGAAFVSDSIQALGQVLDRDIIQYDAGAPESYVCTMDASTGGDGLVATADITSMDDLAGKTVALDKSATSYFFFLQALADSNITEDQINIVEMGNDEAGEAFIAGQVDAAVTWEPALSNCTEREGGHILVSSADYPKAIIDVLTVSNTFAEENPEVYDVLYDCWCKAVDFLNANFEEGCAIMAEGLGLETQEVMDECSGITFYDKAMNEAFNDTSAEDNIFDIATMATNFWLEKGYMEKGDLSGFFPTLELG